MRGGRRKRRGQDGRCDTATNRTGEKVRETERAWGDREKVRRDEESDCGVDVDVMVAMI